MPASISSPTRSADADAGPRVQTIFARGISTASRHSKRLAENRGSRLLSRPMLRTAVVGLAAAACLASCTETRPQPDLVGQDVRLTIIHTADIHSRLFPYNFTPNKFDQAYGLLPTLAPYGGIARIATMVKRIRNSADRSLWLDSGDAWEGAAVFNEFKGEPEIRSLSLAGMEGEVIGNHEFDLGANQLFTELDQWSQFPHLVANYAWDDPTNTGQRSLRDVVQPYEIYDVKGVKVGVIGLGNEDTLQSIYNGGNTLGFRPIDPGVALQNQVALLRGQVDLIVVASHLGLDNDEGLSASMVTDPNAALPLQGVDLILGGHLHIVTNPPKLLPNDDGSNYCKTSDCETLLIHSGAFAKYVGRIDLVVHIGSDNSDPEKRSRIVSYAYDNQPVVTYPTSDPRFIPDDPAVANLMWPYAVKLAQDINLKGVFAYVGPQPTTAVILRNDPSGGDSQLGNLVARSMQTQQGVDAQFAFTNSLGIRDDFSRGPLTNEEMYNVFPFENTIVVMYLSGQEVQDTLDFVAQKSAARGCRTQLQVAGHNVRHGLPRRSGEPGSLHQHRSASRQHDLYRRSRLSAGRHGRRPDDGRRSLRYDVASLRRDRVREAHLCRRALPAGRQQWRRAVESNRSIRIRPRARRSKRTVCIASRSTTTSPPVARASSCSSATPRSKTPACRCAAALTVYLTAQQQSCDGVGIADIPDETDVPASCSSNADCIYSKKCILAGTTGTCMQATVQQKWGNVACLDETVEAHDGRIRPVFQ